MVGRDEGNSPFLAIPRDRWLASNHLAFAVLDRFPVSPGHTLIVPRRVMAQWWDADRDEQDAILELVNDLRELLLDDTARARVLPGVARPDGFNVGFNAGDAAGQTVQHLHVHVIPRFHGDMADPRGGVRHVIPARGNYLAAGASQGGAPLSPATKSALAPIAPPTQPVAPTQVQREALDALAATREDGFGAGLVVMATGLGKTWLAGFDSARPEFARVLFIAHRDEILNQTREVFRRIRPDARIGLIKGPRLDLDAEIVLASVQTLAQRLDLVHPEAFDYVVVDEFHHAAAETYRRVIDHVRPTFLLGLTATPDRMDNADLLALCEDNLVYECGLAEGIASDLLVPFEYFGVADAVDFQPLPWRNARFDPAALEHAVIAQERINAAYDAWAAHSGSRTLAFCVSQRHADVMAREFRDRGVRAVAVHAGEGSAPRHASLGEFARGELDVIFSVDLFNEGLDVPAIDTILLLRPTASPVVFLQQLGRGLRRNEGKTHVRAIDFVGNHRSFLLPARLLAGLGAAAGRTNVTDTELRRMLTEGGFTLPPGCSVHYELTAVKTLLDLLPARTGSRLAAFVQAWIEERGIRPTAVQTFRAGFNPATAPGSWFAFLDDSRHLTEDESRVVRRHGQLLTHVASMSITKSYKLVALRALLRGGWITEPAPVADLAATSRWLVLRDPRLTADVVSATTPDLPEMTLGQWDAYWRKWPLAHLARGGHFRLDGDTFSLVDPASPDDAAVLTALIDELLDWRLTRYLDSKQVAAGGATLMREA